MSISSADVIKLYKSRITILDLLKEQGHDVSEYEDFGINEIHSMYKHKQMDMLIENKTTGGKTYIKYHYPNNLRQANIQNFIDDLFVYESVLEKNDNDQLLIIIKDEPNEPLLKILKNTWEQENIYINVFNIERLQFNILKHVLVPKHRALTKEETNNIKLKYNITDDSKFPDISRFSPPAQAIGLRPGQLCEITRNSRTSITSKFYRICSS